MIRNMNKLEVLFPDQPTIFESIENGSFFKHQLLKNSLADLISGNNNWHLIGSLEHGDHGRNQQLLLTLLKLVKEAREISQKINIHLILGDYRLASQAGQLLEVLEQKLEKYPAQISSLTGSYYAMDDDSRWDRTGTFYQALTTGNCLLGPSVDIIMQHIYAKGVQDQYLKPHLVTYGEMIGSQLVKKNDTVIFFNQEPRGLKQSVKAFLTPEKLFQVVDGGTYAFPNNLNILTMTELSLDS